MRFETHLSQNIDRKCRSGVLLRCCLENLVLFLVLNSNFACVKGKYNGAVTGACKIYKVLNKKRLLHFVIDLLILLWYLVSLEKR